MACVLRFLVYELCQKNVCEYAKLVFEYIEEEQGFEAKAGQWDNEFVIGG